LGGLAKITASPAKAGAQSQRTLDGGVPSPQHRHWAPAFAGEAFKLD